MIRFDFGEGGGRGDLSSCTNIIQCLTLSVTVRVFVFYKTVLSFTVLLLPGLLVLYALYHSQMLYEAG